MARDYKHRANPRKKKRSTAKSGVAWWKWLAVIILLALFAFFLYFLSNVTPQGINQRATIIPIEKTEKKIKKPKHQDVEPKEPEFNFYTILTEEEVVVPEYEINTRSREEKIGKLKETKYIMQAGSFRSFEEADKLKAHLAFLGIESRIEKAEVGDAIWNRVRMGPFKSPSNVAKIKKQLKQNGITAKVTEMKK